MPRSGAFPHFCSEAPAIGAGNPLLQQRRRRLAERSQTERRQQPEDLRRPPPPAAPRARDEARGIAGLGEPRRAEPQPLCAERGFVCGSRRGRRADKGAEPERRVTAGHARPPPPKGPAPEAAMRGRGSRFGAVQPRRGGALSQSSRKLPAGTRGRARLFCSRCGTARARHPPPEPLTVPRGPLLLPGFDIFRRSACLRRARPCAAPRLRAPRRRLPPPAGAMRSLLPSEAASRPQQGALSEPARVVAPLLGHALPRRRRAGRPRSPRRAPPTARDGAGRPAIPTHAPAGSRRTSLPRWRPLESAAAAARGCCCRRTGSRSHGTDRRRRRRARGNPTSCCRRRPPRCRTSRRASAVAEGCPRPDPRSRRAAARRSAPPWRAPGGTAREERPQPLSAHLRRPRPVLWERPPPRPALLRAAPRRGRHSVAMAVPRRAPGRRRWTRNPRAVGGSAGAPVGRAGSC